MGSLIALYVNVEGAQSCPARCDPMDWTSPGQNTGVGSLPFSKRPYTTAKMWKQLKRPSGDEWINRMQSIQWWNFYTARQKKEVLTYHTDDLKTSCWEVRHEGPHLPCSHLPRPGKAGPPRQTAEQRLQELEVREGGRVCWGLGTSLGAVMETCLIRSADGCKAVQIY